MIYVGWDCGKSGAYVAIGGCEIIQKGLFPTVKDGKGRDYDIKALEWIVKNLAEFTHIIEDPGKHAPSASGLYSMTASFWALKTLMVVHGCRHHVVSARKWQNTYWTRPKMPKGAKFDTKAQALKCAKMLWPGETWLATDRCRKEHDGLIDASLIAEYGRRLNL